MTVAILPPVTARAASDPGNHIFDVSEGSITVGAGTNGGTLKVTYGASQTLDNIPASQNITIIGTTTSNTVIVSSGVTANITLSGVSIDVSEVSDAACAFNMTGATVTLTLADGTSNYLKSGNNCAGLQVPNGAELTINGSGTLTAPGRMGAGIGGGDWGSGGTITIMGGTVSTSGYGGAAIGGGCNGAGGTVIISGGTVTAENFDLGAAIGGGCYGAGGTVIISGGTVTASAHHVGAGIGGGNSGVGGTVTISGGMVTASGNLGAGIGGGYQDVGGTVTITGGTVTASGGTYGSMDPGAGIGGGGNGRAGGTVTITGGSVKAISTHNAESIGYGNNGTDSGTLTNGSGTNVYLTTVTLEDVTAKTAVSLLTTSPDYAYGINDMQTDADGKLYLYLPESTRTTDAQTSTARYAGDITTTADHTANGTLEIVPDIYTISYNTNGGSGTMENNTAIQGIAFTLPNNGFIAPDGKQFKEWAIGDAATGTKVAAGGSYTFTATTTVYAVWEDSALPTVSAVTPDGTDVSINGNIVITFSRAMDTVTSGAVYLSDDGGTTYGSALSGGSWSAGDTVYTVPYSNLSYSTEYTVDIEDFTDTAGITMAANDTHSFTTCVEPIIPSVSPGALTIDNGGTASLIIAFGQGSAAATDASITVGNSSIASVSQTLIIAPGSVIVTGLAVGTTEITVVFNDTASTTATVSVTVQMRSSDSSGGVSSSTPSKPTYIAIVRTDNRADDTLPVTVNADTGSAAVNMGVQQGSIISGGGNVTVIMPSVPSIGSYSLGVPAALLTTPGGGSLTFDTDTGSITLPGDMLAGISGAEGRKAEITIGQEDKSGLSDNVKNAIGDRPLISLSLLADGKQTDWNNPGTPVIVSIPYTPAKDELKNSDSIVVWYIDGSGNPQCVTNGQYDPVTGTVAFDITHFSDYAVVYHPVSFNDVKSGAWYYRAVSFIAARDITNGTGGGNFSPNAHLKRGDFLVMLMKAYGIAPDTSPADNFSDAGNTYYTGYLAAAKRLGISIGVGDNMYAPDKEITRQEMFTLLYNALNVLGQLPEGDSGKTISDFTDAGQIDTWAKDAMALLVKTGTVGGSGGKLNPTGTTTRAEMAQVLYNLLNRKKA